ncbi:MAG: YbhB/YbcL family Raf kinase inhibitor-like protein [Candidatus Sedimenticola sp. 20ELBAFRAG]
MSFQISSSAFINQGDIPRIYTCDSSDLSPPLQWCGLPEGAASLVLIVDDPDAPDPAAPKMTWVHWILYNLPTSLDGLAEGVGQLPGGSLEGMNDWGRTGYGGPCPPVGSHRYYFKLYALDLQLPDMSKPNKGQLEQAMSGHVLGMTELMGRYQRS